MPPVLKRFWTDVEAAAADGGWRVALDGKPLRTPAGAPFLAPTRALAEAAADEWRAAPERPDPRFMPLTRAVNTALDRTRPHHAEVVRTVAAYAGADLVCYRAPHPPALVRRQAEAWDPVLAWAEARHGAPLIRVEGVMHAPQPPASLAALAAAVEATEPFALTALHELTALSGSLLLALAAAEGEIAPQDAWARSRVDEDFQAEQWGEDAEAAAAATAKRDDFLAAARLHALLAPDAPETP